MNRKKTEHTQLTNNQNTNLLETTLSDNSQSHPDYDARKVQTNPLPISAAQNSTVEIRCSSWSRPQLQAACHDAKYLPSAEVKFITRRISKEQYCWIVIVFHWSAVRLPETVHQEGWQLLVYVVKGDDEKQRNKNNLLPGIVPNSMQFSINFNLSFYNTQSLGAKIIVLQLTHANIGTAINIRIMTVCTEWRAITWT